MSLKYRPAALLRNFIVLAAALAFCGSADAGKLKVLYAFCPDQMCANGGNPAWAPARDSAGNLYGITSGTPSNGPKVFKLSKDKGDWTLHVLYQFCNGCSTRQPSSPLIVDLDGNLYGTAVSPSERDGQIFKLSPSTDGSPWTYTALHDFTGNRYVSEGALTYRGAAAGLPYDGTSPLYGPSAIGGDAAHGTVFALTPRATRWAYRTIFSFCKDGTQCRKGWAPFDTLTMDGSGNLYGVTAAGGAKRSQGVVFKLAPVAKGHWNETVLYEFCTSAKCSDGAQPLNNSIALGENGEIFGTTLGGGGGGPICCGVAYKLAAGGSQTVMYRFCQVNQCGDGRQPNGGLVADASGGYLGITSYGGGTFDPNHIGGGTIFALGDKFRELHAFCADGDCSDGAYPVGPLVGDGAGHYYGVTNRGGAHGYGTVYEFTP